MVKPVLVHPVPQVQIRGHVHLQRLALNVSVLRKKRGMGLHVMGRVLAVDGLGLGQFSGSAVLVPGHGLPGYGWPPWCGWIPAEKMPGDLRR
jgi:hypothetical protein